MKGSCLTVNEGVVNVDRYGNTSSASIPIAYDEVVREGRVRPGDLVVLTGFGGGFTWGSVLFKNSLGGPVDS